VSAFVVVAPEVLGGVTPETELAILIGAVLVGAVASVIVSRSRHDLGLVPMASIGMAIAVTWTFVQLVPLPCGFIAQAFPERIEIMHELVKLGALDTLRCTITGAPGATRAALALAATLLQLVLTAVALSRAGHRRVLLQGVAMSSLVMALVALTHVVVDADKVFGLYAPRHAHPGLLLAPLLNANHLAGLLALGFPLCLSFGLTEERLEARIGWLAGGFIVLVCTMFTLSRGGAGAIVFGGGGYLLFHVLRRRRSGISTKTKIAAGAGLVVACLSAYLGADLVADVFRAEGASLEKLNLPAQLFALARKHPWLGVGRGALGDASPGIFSGAAWVLYAENFLAHWSIEWGIAVTVIIVLPLAGSIVRVRPRRRQEAALAFGVVALILQNLVDFSLEIAGVACAAAIAFGVLISREHRLGALRRLRLQTFQPISVLATGAGLLFAAPVLTKEARPNIRLALEQSLNTDPHVFDLKLSRGLRQYPLDPALIVYGSAGAIRTRRRNAAKWLNLSMRVAPHWFGPHLQAAYYFEQLGRLDEAAVEFGLAADIDYHQWWSPVCEFVNRHPRAELALASTALGTFRRLSLDRVLACLGPTPKEAEHFAKLALAEDPSLVSAYLLLARSAAQRKDEEEARGMLTQALRAGRPDARVWATYLNVIADLGHGREALAQYAKLPATASNERSVIWAAAQIAADLEDARTLEPLLGKLIGRFGTTVAIRAQLEAAASRLYSRAGEPLRAVARAQSAFDALGTPELAELTHSAALRANMPGIALRMAAELCQVAYRSGWYCSNPTLAPP
jgi:tetratricopeptide (TPR) repeat protein